VRVLDLLRADATECADMSQGGPLVLDGMRRESDLHGSGRERRVAERIHACQKWPELMTAGHEVIGGRAEPAGQHQPGNEALELPIQGELLYQRQGVPTGTIPEPNAERTGAPAPRGVDLESKTLEVCGIGVLQLLILGRENEGAPARFHWATSAWLAIAASIASIAWRYSVASQASLRCR